MSTIKKNLQDLPAAAPSDGTPPNADPKFVTELAEAWYEQLLAGGVDLDLAIPEAGPYRASWAGKRCDRALFYALRGDDESNPPGVADQWRFAIGHMVHEGIQKVMHKMRDGNVLVEENVDLNPAGIPGSAHADLIVLDDDGNEVCVVEYKGLAIETPLPTPTGWVSMGDVAVGDTLFGSDGRPCTVTATSEIKWVPSYRIKFDDGSSIIADEDHRWVVQSGRSSKLREQVVTTKEIAETVRVGGRANHRIINTRPLDTAEATLPVHPYVLGAWIGDGAKHGQQITQRADSKLWGEIERCGYALGRTTMDDRSNTHTRSVLGLRSTLKLMGLLGEPKQIPPTYLRASASQRLDLLQGLMDTDGSWGQQRREAIYTTTDKALAEQVHELVVSLGMRCHITAFTATGFGVQTEAFHVTFRPNQAQWPFRIKGDPTTPDSIRSTRRVIHSVEPIGDVRTKCVTVDSPDHTYLAGEQMVPTHNTINGFGFKMAATSFKGPPEGPRSGHALQAAMVAVARGVPYFAVGYFSLENLSPSMAGDFSNGEIGRFTAEWRFKTDDWIPEVNREAQRIARILADIEADRLTPRTITDPDYPTGALIEEPDRKGRWQATTEDGVVVGTGTVWFCSYCDQYDRCLSDGATPVTIG